MRPYIRAFDSTEYMNGLATGEFCISMSWSGDYATSRARAKAAGVDVHLAFTVPKEGANGSFDALLIPADAPHPPERAQVPQLHPRAAGDRRRSPTRSTTPTTTSRPTPYVDPQILTIRRSTRRPRWRRGCTLSHEVAPPLERLRTRTWTRIKTDL